MNDFWIHINQCLQTTENWLLIGVAILLGHFGGKLSKKLGVPSVFGYLLVGVVFGTSVLNIISLEQVADSGRSTLDSLHMVTDLGLGIVAFMIGSQISRELIGRMGSKLLIIMLSECFFAFIIVFLSVWVLGIVDWGNGAYAIAAALIFAAMAPASAPAGTVAVIQEYKAKGPLTNLLLAVVGLDDGLGIMIYAFAAAAAKLLLGAQEINLGTLVGGPILEIVGGLAVGAAVGLGLMAIASRTRSRSELLTVSIGAILLTTGLANALHLSLILSNLAVGTVMANLSPSQTERSYGVVEQITHPIYVLFFIIAGAHLDVYRLVHMTFVAPIYIVGRTVGLMGGAYLGAVISKADRSVRKYLGLGILSQAGVAIGLALMVAKEFGSESAPFAPEFKEQAMNLALLTINTIAVTTIFFEILGPITTKIALSKAGEIDKNVSDKE